MRAYHPGRRLVRRLAPIALVVLAGLVVPASATVTGTLSQITTANATASQTTPAIAGTLLVWDNSARLAGGMSNQDIFWEDVALPPNPQNLTNTPGMQEFLEDIDGSNVVFTQTSPTSAGDILLADLSAKTPVASPVASADPNGSFHYEQPSIGGRYIVFIKAGVTQSDVVAYDNALGLMLPMITNDPAVQAGPRVSGNMAVWEDWNSGNADVFGMTIGQPPSFPIATGAHNQRTPDIDGNHVVWVDSTPGGDDQIWVYDLTTRVGRQLTTAPGSKIGPRISGNRIVWSDSRNGGNLDIYTWDLTTDTEDLLAGGAGDQMLADIDGNRVVYTSNATGFEQVYLFTIVAPPPPPPPPGNVPLGCDPTKTDLADGPVTLSRLGKKAVNASHSFMSQPGKRYYVCVENGDAGGANRTAHLIFIVDNDVVLTPADFKPNNDPPHWVSRQILDGDEDETDDDEQPHHFHHGGQKHVWSAALFGKRWPSKVTLTIRVGK